jgi:hypothetical protein
LFDIVNKHQDRKHPLAVLYLRLDQSRSVQHNNPRDSIARELPLIIFKSTVASSACSGARRLCREQQPHLNNQRSNTMKFPTHPAHITEAEMDAGFDEVLAEASANGWIVATGEMEWSNRRQMMIPVYKSLVFGMPPAADLN